MKTAATVIRFTLLAGVLFAANPRAGFTQDGGIYVSSCNAQAVAALGPAGPRAATFIDNPFGALAMQNFGCW